MIKKHTITHRILLLLSFLIMMGSSSAWAQTHTEQYDYDGDGVEETYHVVYLLVGGSNGSGVEATSPVNSWANAYKKLPKYTGTTDEERNDAWDHNIIVVLNTNTSATLQIDETIAKANHNQGIPATITGVWPWTTEKTTATNVKTNGGKVMLDAGNSSKARLGADTKFKYIRFGSNSSGYLMMYLHDTWFDVGCVTHEIPNALTSSLGLINDGQHSAPDMEVFLFSNTYNFNTSSTDGNWNSLMKKPVTLTIRSGKFGRILSTRITGVNVPDIQKRYVVGNPSNPLMCVVNVDIDPTTSTGEWNPNNYTDDIAYLCAGSTQGAEYCDVEFNIERGRIGTLVGAMQGNTITNCTAAKLSNSSFFGRTVCNIDKGSENDVNIYRYFAACFGRQTDNQTSIANAAFYGHSILNMYGGTIESGVFVSAGGISGLQSPDGAYHTNDQFIPYIDNTASFANYPFMGIKYQPYEAGKIIAKVTTTLKGESEVIDLAETVTQMNIYGGIINGGLYGGSFGFSPELPASVAIAGAGSLWGETNVNIYGGTINGGVYGGGAGATEYYNAADANKKAGFLTVASVYGNTNVNIYGGTFDTTGIFGGGAGVAATGAVGTDTEFLNIAKVYGTTNVTINPQTLKDRAEWADPNVPEFTGPDEDWTFTGNIYGGGALGSVEGTTNVVIKGGIINGNVFGAGMGENGHPDKAKVTGSTNVTVDSNWTAPTSEPEE